MTGSFVLPTPELRRLAQEIYDFEASRSRKKTGTGSRREGKKFEKLVAKLWGALAEYCEQRGAAATPVRGPSKSNWTRLDLASRSLYLPAPPDAYVGATPEEEVRWLDLKYSVSDLVGAFPGTEEAVERYSPDIGPYSGLEYPAIYANRSTSFDGAIVMEEDGVLLEKILLEYKSAKSTKGSSIDGNAHERLSFQILQYLEIAPRYSACSMAVIANGAFTKYRNKYHVNFRVQADRLRVFRCFDMEYLATVSEYGGFLVRLCEWLVTGRPRRCR